MPHQVNRGRKINKELAPNFEGVHVGDDEARHHSCESLRFDPFTSNLTGSKINGGADGANSKWLRSPSLKMSGRFGSSRKLFEVYAY